VKNTGVRDQEANLDEKYFSFNDRYQAPEPRLLTEGDVNRPEIFPQMNGIVEFPEHY